MKICGAGMAVAEPFGPAGLAKPGEPVPPAPHQLQKLQALTVTFWPAESPVLGVMEVVGLAGVGSLAYATSKARAM